MTEMFTKYGTPQGKELETFSDQLRDKVGKFISGLNVSQVELRAIGQFLCAVVDVRISEQILRNATKMRKKEKELEEKKVE